MNKQQAHQILDNYKSSCLKQINEALLHTGDLDAFQDSTGAYRTLRDYGNESCYVRTRQIEGAGIGERFNWTLDWNRKRDQGAN